MNIEIICPLYNAEKYIIELHNSLLMQKNVQLNNIRYIITEGTDNTEEIIKEFKNCKYKVIKKKEFSHSLTRENEAFESNSDIVVFITQDVEIKDENWLYELVKPIIDEEADASFSRQIAKYENIEKYTREKNYPLQSYVVSSDDIDRLGLRTFFYSDASSAVKANVFRKLKGYDGKKLPINEDMYIAYKLIINGYRIKYCADSKVIHSHDFTLKQIYERYKLTGKFFKENSYLDNYGTTESGTNLAIYILKRILQEQRYSLLLRYPFDMCARFFGMKVGKM